MNVLLVGGAGYIGSHMTRHLLRNGHEPWVFDNLATGHRAAVPTGRLIEGEMKDRKHVEGSCPKCEIGVG